MANSADFVWMDGEIVPWERATIHVSAETVLRGANVFEGMRAYWRPDRDQLYIFRIEDHLRRLRQSAKIMRMTIPYSDAELTAAFIELIQRNRFRDNVHFRPVVYFDHGEANAWLPDEIRTGVFVLAYSRPTSRASMEGIQSCTSTWRRNSDVSSPSRIKAAGNYHNSRLAHVEARINGFGMSVMLNEHGKVSEGPSSCLMLVRDGVVITPGSSADILESITRDTLIRLFREMGVPVVERDVDRTELYIADELFFCGSGAEVLPVRSIDHYPVGDGEVGPLTRRIRARYFEVAQGLVPEYTHWVLPVFGPGEPREPLHSAVSGLAAPAAE
jgi:branched-chain amino acid aminotransferase